MQEITGTDENATGPAIYQAVRCRVLYGFKVVMRRSVAF